MSCSGDDGPAVNDGNSTPEGMVEICPVLPGTFVSIPRVPGDAGKMTSRVYDDDETTNSLLVKLVQLPEGSTVWLIAKNETTDESGNITTKYVKKSYVVYLPDEDLNIMYLVPCRVKPDGTMIDMESAPLYLKSGKSYSFYAISPARELDETEFNKGNIQFKAYNGTYFYANDGRYSATTPEPVMIEDTPASEGVYEVNLKPMINQTAELKFQLVMGEGVHDLDIQPSGIEVSGLQDDDPDGVLWHMSQYAGDDPIEVKHGDKNGTYHQYDYVLDKDGNINIKVPILPMWSISKPVIVLFRIKVNGVPTSYEIMLNEKDFKAGYSYGYRGTISISENVSVISWQFISWELDVEFP